MPKQHPLFLPPVLPEKVVDGLPVLGLDLVGATGLPSMIRDFRTLRPRPSRVDWRRGADEREVIRYATLGPRGAHRGPFAGFRRPPLTKP